MAKTDIGRTNYLAGLGAADSVARHYAQLGLNVVQQRFRGKRGEIDLIVRDGPTTVFVEVKRAKTHANAAERVSADKIRRLWITAEEYCARTSTELLSDMRFDVALVDQLGRVVVHENALMA